MKRIDKNKVKTMIDVVTEYEKSREFEPITEEEVCFYDTAFWQLVYLIEDALGEKLCKH